jgi:DNA helicase HerA-like ATPase
MPAPIPVAQRGDIRCELLPALANRHGLITGATGTGKTLTLQALAEHFSRLGVPVFMADVKGDLTGISQPGRVGAKLAAALQERGLPMPDALGCPCTLWDVFGTQGHPVRATVSDLGPLLLARMLALNDTQAGVLNLVFKIADDRGLALLDMKDLRAMLQHVGDNASAFQTEYGNISAASIGAIQRGLMQIEAQGGDRFFGEPMLDINDLLQTVDGHGVVNILTADQLMNAPRLYATFLLWLLSEIFEHLLEVGDLEQPKLVFFFDEAHLLFKGAPAALVERIELVVRLVRSKGVGVYFVTQNPLDVPDSVLAQLGNRVQHALRAFTPRDQKAVRAAADTMRQNPAIPDMAAAIMELAVGEALVSFLDEKGRPSVTERVFVRPPGSQIGPITAGQRQALLAGSLVAGVYETAVDRDSAYEKLRGRAAASGDAGAAAETGASGANGTTGATGGDGGLLGGLKDVLFGSTGPRGGRHEGLAEKAAASAVRSIGSAVGREIIRGVLGSLLGGSKRR